MVGAADIWTWTSDARASKSVLSCHLARKLEVAQMNDLKPGSILSTPLSEMSRTEEIIENIHSLRVHFSRSQGPIFLSRSRAAETNPPSFAPMFPVLFPSVRGDLAVAPIRH